MTQQIPKLNADGKPLYLLPQPDLEVAYMVPVTVKTTNNTGNPVTYPIKVPMRDENGAVKSYEVTRTVEITEEQTDENGNVTVVVVGYAQEGTGQFLDLYLTEEAQEHNELGDPLFWETVDEPAVRYEPQQPLEITEYDPLYVDGLEPALESVPDPLPPPPDPAIVLQAAKDAKYAEFKRLETEKLESFVSPALGTPHTYLSGPDDMTLLTGEFTFINSAMYDGGPIVWFTVESGNVAHTKDQFNSVYSDGRNHVGETKYTRAALEAQVSAATTPEEVEAVVWGV